MNFCKIGKSQHIFPLFLPKGENISEAIIHTLQVLLQQSFSANVAICVWSEKSCTNVLYNQNLHCNLLMAR